jgi:hypothetical protein
LDVSPTEVRKKAFWGYKTMHLTYIAPFLSYRDERDEGDKEDEGDVDTRRVGDKGELSDAQ